MRNTLPIPITEERIAEFCRKNHIARLSFFGSVLRNDFRPDSDVDVLVEFEEGKIPGLAFFRMQEEFANMVGRKVDLLTPDSIKSHYRQNILSSAKEYYAQS